MEKSWFNSMLSKGEVEYRCGISTSMDSLGPIENTSISEDLVINDPDKMYKIKIPMAFAALTFPPTIFSFFFSLSKPPALLVLLIPLST